MAAVPLYLTGVFKRISGGGSTGSGTGSSSAVRSGWKKSGEVWYYYDAGGSMVTGWLLDNGKWYYFAPDTGMMVRGTSVGGYYLNSDGVWVH